MLVFNVCYASSGKENMNSVIRNSYETTCNNGFSFPGSEEGVVWLKFSGACFHFSAMIMFSYFLFVIIELVQNFSVVYIVLHYARDAGYILQNL
jgi:hypothetical protein